MISNQMVLELPGNAERVEIALSHVLVDVCSFYCSAQVFLTSYRLAGGVVGRSNWTT